MDGLIGSYLRPGFDDGRPPPNVLYVEDFDDLPAPPPAEQAEIFAPGYTAEDVEAAREEGRQAGLDEARGEHEALQAALTSAALTAIGDGLANGRAEAARIAAAAAEDIAGAVLALLQAALPATAATLAAAEIDALLGAILPPLRREPGVTLRVHPAILPLIGGHLAGFSDLTAQPDPDMARSDLTITWRDGQARRDWPKLWADITAALTPFGLPPDLAALARGAGGYSHGE